MLRRTIHAMGTRGELLLLPVVDGRTAERALAGALAEIARIERLASRFQPDSELSRLNAEGSLVVSPDLLRLIRLALALRSITEGRFDPTVQPALVAAGYDRSFVDLPHNGPAAGDPVPAGGRVTIDPQTGEVTLAEGVGLDLGGIAKGWAAERAADLLATTGPCLVNLGGDIAVRGLRDGRPWPVAVTRADGPATLGLAGAGMATSGTERRQWRRAGRRMHHLIDPASGRPARSDLVRVSVVAADAAIAEAWAKALLLAGRERARREAEEHGFAAVLVGADGRTTDVGVTR
ncbi:MAG TPA: FAD:protein FMN transferase [Miltoncostaeaceae bacterium]|nr:FAD:protein FMN transferase [Miltoncostaeaceae bacterium]